MLLPYIAFQSQTANPFAKSTNTRIRINSRVPASPPSMLQSLLPISALDRHPTRRKTPNAHALLLNLRRCNHVAVTARQENPQQPDIPLHEAIYCMKSKRKKERR